MKNIALAISVVFALSLIFPTASATLAKDNSKGDFGFGLQAGDPSGFTIKYWTSRRNAFAAYLGGSYFGSPRIGVDYAGEDARLPYRFQIDPLKYTDRD